MNTQSSACRPASESASRHSSAVMPPYRPPAVMLHISVTLLFAVMLPVRPVLRPPHLPSRSLIVAFSVPCFLLLFDFVVGDRPVRFRLAKPTRCRPPRFNFSWSNFENKNLGLYAGGAVHCCCCSFFFVVGGCGTETIGCAFGSDISWYDGRWLYLLGYLYF